MAMTTVLHPAAAVSFKDVLDVLVELRKAQGASAVQSVLARFGCAGKTVLDLEPLNRNAEIIAYVNAMLTEGTTTH